MSIDLVVFIVCSVASALLGLLIFVRNPHQPGNQRFAFLAASLISWTLFNYLSDHSSGEDPRALLFTRLAMLGGIASIYFALNFIANFPSETIFRKKLAWRLHKYLTLLLVPIVFTPAFITSVSGSAFSGTINTSYLYNLFIVYVAYSLLLLFVTIKRQIRAAKSVIQKQQILIVSWGIALYAVLAISSNVLVPLVVDDWSSSRFGPAFTLLFLGMIAYSIVKHSLFDIRLVIARSFGYILVLVSLAAIFGASIVAMTSIFFNDQSISHGTEAVYVIMALVAAFLLQPLKKFFDRLSNNLFYRDAYDSQELLNNLNRSLVTTIDLTGLLTKSSQIIDENLKIEYCTFAIGEPQKQSFRFIGESKVHIDPEAVKKIVQDVTHLSHRAVVSDQLAPAKHHLKELMQASNIAVLVKLQGRIGGNVQHPGYILLGQKRSGGLYSEQDIKVLEIIADELVIAIQNSLRFEEIQQFNITLQEKIEAATKELRRTNAKLKALDEAKDEFISMASHQLRTPLTAIKGYISMILDGDAGAVKPKQKEMMQQSFDGAQRMVYLISDLLNVSRLQTGKFVIDNQPANLAEMVIGEMSQLKDQAAAKEIEMSYDKPTEFPTLNIDETKVRQVIMNFLDNALYYTPKGGKVTVNLEAKADSVEFTVKDTGVGVPKAVQHNLFTKFYRADNARKMRPDGTGLGLFMAKKVIVAQGGAIIFNSVEDQGSTFGFSLPRASLEVRPDQKPPKGGGASMPITNPTL